ncbi:MAG: hypothetical protein AB7W16_09325 [Candidatus Obscuribacterales bacterium]
MKKKINLRRRIAVSGFVLCVASLIVLIIYCWTNSPATLITTISFIAIMVLLELLYSARRVFFRRKQ